MQSQHYEPTVPKLLPLEFATKPIPIQIVPKFLPLEFATKPEPIQLVEKNLDKIDWYRLSDNPNAIPLLEKNTNIMVRFCKDDYDDMKKEMQPLAEEIAAYVFHPVRMNRIAERNNIPFDELITEIY